MGLSERLRATAGRVADGAKDLGRRASESRSRSRIDQDPEAEELPPLDGDREEDTELARRDRGDAPPIEIPAHLRMVDFLRRIDPVPELPLTAVHESGLRAVMVRTANLVNADLDRFAMRALNRIVNRLTITVGPDGITVRGAFRSRHTQWKHIKELTLASRYDVFREQMAGDYADDIGNFLPPIPGLNWVLRRIMGGITGLVERRIYEPSEIAGMRQDLGWVLTDIKRRGFDIEIDGALQPVALLSMGLSQAIIHEAQRRGVKLAGWSPSGV